LNRKDATVTDCEKDRQCYFDAIHAMQTGVAAWMNYDRSETDPKHLRVGINSALRASSSLARLLIAKSIITEAEYTKAIADGMEEEAASYQTRLQEKLSRAVTLH